MGCYRSRALFHDPSVLLLCLQAFGEFKNNILLHVCPFGPRYTEVVWAQPLNIIGSLIRKETWAAEEN